MEGRLVDPPSGGLQVTWDRGDGGGGGGGDQEEWSGRGGGGGEGVGELGEQVEKVVEQVGLCGVRAVCRMGGCSPTIVVMAGG